MGAGGKSRRASNGQPLGSEGRVGSARRGGYRSGRCWSMAEGTH